MNGSRLFKGKKRSGENVCRVVHRAVKGKTYRRTMNPHRIHVARQANTISYCSLPRPTLSHNAPRLLFWRARLFTFRPRNRSERGLAVRASCCSVVSCVIRLMVSLSTLQSVTVCTERRTDNIKCDNTELRSTGQGQQERERETRRERDSEREREAENGGVGLSLIHI